MPKLPLALLLYFGLCVQVQAHNGATAIAVPLEDIVIDGELADWPADMERYP